MNGTRPNLLFLALLLALPAAGQQPVRYELRFPAASHHEAEVTATFPDVPSGPLNVVLSRSSPGRYAVHEFSKNIYNVHATDPDGRELAVERTAPNQWRIAGHGGTVRFHYTLFGDRVDGTYNAIDLTHAHLNGPATFVFARGLEQRPVLVKLEAPLDLPWSVATQLSPASDGWWGAPNRDHLIDSPIEFGVHKTREWRVLDTSFRLVLHSSTADEISISDYARMCEAVTAEAAGVFGGFPRYDNGSYTFLLDYQPYASTDAMEHRNSTVISRPSELNRRTYRDLIDSVSHEFFHSWNVERIRPRSLEPFDLEHENASGELWFAEGFTNYYGPLILARSGIWNLDGFAADLTTAIDVFLNSPARRSGNAPLMSRMAPLFDGTGMMEPSNQQNTFLSYYYFGETLALGIDLSIRSRFPGRSLDDWMRAMWRSHPDIDKPYTEEDLQRTLAEVTDREFAREIFTRYVLGSDTMDYDALLARAGLAIRKAEPNQVWFGARQLNFPGRGVIVSGPVLQGSPAYAAGIDRGDRVVAIDGKEIKDQREWERILKSFKPGDRSRIQVEGRSGRRNVGIVWMESPNVALVTYESIKQPLTPGILEFRQSWLGSKALQPLPKLP